MNRPVYLDYNGTTPIDPMVAEAMRPFIETEFGNPSSGHLYGIKPKQAVETARRQVSSLLGCRADEIVFTSGGTESNNHALKGAFFAAPAGKKHLVVTAVEHPAILEVCRFLERLGAEVTYLPVDSRGMVSISDLKKSVRADTLLISVMHANNEVGTVQPIADISEIARRKNVLFHTDAAQSVGKIPTDVAALGVDMMSVAGHKVYAPKGIGALFIRKGIEIEPFCHGAAQERGLRAGTENVTEIVGLGKACEIAKSKLVESETEMTVLRDRLSDRLVSELQNVRINGHPEMRLPNTLNISFKELEANRVLEEIGLKVAASAGAACHADTVDISHVLRAMHVPEEWAKGTLRFSVGRMTTTEEIDRAATVVIETVKKMWIS